MSHTSPFTGSEFRLQSVTQIGLATVRVRFTQDPLAANQFGANDALNPAQYEVSGPGVNYINDCSIVPGDPQSIDLALADVLLPGTWTLSVVGPIKTIDADPLVAPTSAFFTAADLAVQDPVSGGAESDDAEETLRKNLNPALQGAAWDALIAALATGDQRNWDNAFAAFDQCFKSTASGTYLDRKMGEGGVVRPRNVGMPDDLFRRLGIIVSTDALTQEVLLEAMEAFYGSDAVRAHATTDLYEPFSLLDGDTLEVLIDERDTFLVTFDAASFARTSAALANEVAAAINRAFRLFGSKAFATAFKGADDNVYLRIYSGSLGLGGSVRIKSGRAQNALWFPTKLTPQLTSTLPSWDITKDEARGVLRFKATTGVSNFDLRTVQIGDYVNIFGNEFNTDNRGAFAITDVSFSFTSNNSALAPIQWFEIENEDGVEQLGLTQLTEEGVRFFRPERKTIHVAQSRTVVVSQDGGETRIVLPATTQIVGRGPRRAAYAQVRDSVDVTSIVREVGGLVTVVANSHGLLEGRNFILDGAVADTAPAVTNGNGTSTTNRWRLSGWTTLASMTVAARKQHTLIKLAGGDVLVVGGYDAAGPTYIDTCKRFHVSSTSSTADGVQHTYQWVNAASISTGVSLGAASLLLDDEVLFTGGKGAGGAVDDCSIYDPDSDTWSAAADLDTERYGHCQVLLSNGLVLVAGGKDSNNTKLASCELYDQDTDTWAAGGTMTKARYLHQLTLLANGKILVTGGGTNVCEVYDPDTDTWSDTGGMTYTRESHAAVIIPDGRVFAIGGVGRIATQPGSDSPVLDCEMWDPTTEKWTPAGRLYHARSTCSAHYVESLNRIYVIGGSSTSVEYLDLATMKWHTSTAVLSQSRIDAVGVLLDEGVILLVGGERGGTVTNKNDLLQPAEESYQRGSLNEICGRVLSVVDANTFTYQSSEATWAKMTSSGATVTPVSAAASSTPGPFIFNRTGSPAVTSVESDLIDDINRGHQYDYVEVSDATMFPDEPGYLVFGFGYRYETYPVKYLGRLSDTRLRLDFGYKFPKSVPAGAMVTLLRTKNTYTPDSPEDVGAFYLTASAAGRIAASKTVDDILAGGIPVNKEVVYPGDRGLAGEGLPAHGVNKLSDKVSVWGGDDLDAELTEAREGD